MTSLSSSTSPAAFAPATPVWGVVPARGQAASRWALACAAAAFLGVATVPDAVVHAKWTKLCLVTRLLLAQHGLGA